LEKIPGIPQSARVWGRINDWVTKCKQSQIESKAISYNVYKRTPSPGRIYLDLLTLYQRDTTLRLYDYKLETVAQHFLKKGRL
jgi:DNA polymerase elongation subunit (family B)